MMYDTWCWLKQNESGESDAPKVVLGLWGFILFDAALRLDTSEGYLIKKPWNKCSQTDTSASFKADPYFTVQYVKEYL